MGIEHVEAVGEDSAERIDRGASPIVRPQIIRDGTDAQQVAEELRSKLRGSVGASTDDLRIRTVR